MMQAEWRKSSYSFANHNCVEVGTGPAVVALRDSKDPRGPVLRVSLRTWAEFATRVKRGG
ncbi:MAG TPA: DUF397 domain-containing protein [Streptosporangiaceae bacterium]|jgi:hypothetical protein|nr:DUF397 domain-containing protein [Streptosporangiaceae bacterium]